MHPLDVNEWGWTSRPTTDAELEAMMISLDTYLASKKVLTYQRYFANKSVAAKIVRIGALLVGSAFITGADEADPTLNHV